MTNFLDRLLSWHNRQALIFLGQLALVLVAVVLLAIAPPVAVLVMALLVAGTAGVYAVVSVGVLGVLLMVLLR